MTRKPAPEISNPTRIANLAFLVHLSGHLNMLKLKVSLQGKGQLIIDMIYRMRAFSRKLTLRIKQLREDDTAHFLTLETDRAPAVLNDYVQVLIAIQNELNSRFQYTESVENEF